MLKKSKDMLRNANATVKNAVMLAPVLVAGTAVNAFAEEATGGKFTLPALPPDALAPIATGFNQYAGPIMLAGIGFIAVKKGISFVPKLINMFFK